MKSQWRKALSVHRRLRPPEGIYCTSSGSYIIPPSYAVPSQWVMDYRATLGKYAGGWYEGGLSRSDWRKQLLLFMLMFNLW